MGELLARRFLSGSDISVSSAGTRGLPGQSMDSYAAALMENIGIETCNFRSHRIQRQSVCDANLILCFEKKQRSDIVLLDPSAVRRSFVLTEFAQMCEYCATQGIISGDTIGEKLDSVIRNAALIRPLLPEADDIADPYGQDPELLRMTAACTNHEIHRIMMSVI